MAKYSKKNSRKKPAKVSFGAYFIVVLAAVTVCLFVLRDVILPLDKVYVPTPAIAPATVSDPQAAPEVVSAESLGLAGAADVVELTGSRGINDGEQEQALQMVLADKVLVQLGAEYEIEKSLTELEIPEEPITYFGYNNLGIAEVSNHLNIREKPVDGNLVGKLSNHAACEVLDIEDGWAHIKSGKVEGYVSTEFLLTGPKALLLAQEVIEPVAIVSGDGLKVREQPSINTPVITFVSKGEELIVLDQMDGWIKVDLDGEEAYVSADYVKVEDKLQTAVSMKDLLQEYGVQSTRAQLVEYAKQFIGNRYVWGGVSLTKGVDCSGFTMQIYKKYGISLPHHAASQANYGTRVTAETIRPGDLIFYSKGGRINHVGIYIGNGQVLHASSPRTGIKISSMYYRTPARMISLLP